MWHFDQYPKIQSTRSRQMPHDESISYDRLNKVVTEAIHRIQYCSISISRLHSFFLSPSDNSHRVFTGFCFCLIRCKKSFVIFFCSAWIENNLTREEIEIGNAAVTKLTQMEIGLENFENEIIEFQLYIFSTNA